MDDVDDIKDLRKRIENLESWSEVLMTAIGTLGSHAEPLLADLEDVRQLYRRSEWSDGKDPRDKADDGNWPKSETMRKLMGIQSTRHDGP